MNPEEMQGGAEGVPEEEGTEGALEQENVEVSPEHELLVKELELINNELIANNASNHLGDDALAEKLRRQQELMEMIAGSQN